MQKHSKGYYIACVIVFIVGLIFGELSYNATHRTMSFTEQATGSMTGFVKGGE